MKMEFANSGYLLLLLLLLPYIAWCIFKRKGNEPTMRMSDTFAYRNAPKSLRVRLIHIPFLLRCITYAMVVVALARPQTNDAWNEKEVQGINIMLAMDVSASMLSDDVMPNRLVVAKDVAADFISGRPNDNIGLTIFAGEAFTQCPLTTDHATLQNLLQSVRGDLVQMGLIQDGTAIGMGLANAVGRLKDVQSKSKVVILLTDGSNNVGSISPLTAAQIAKKFGVRVYTIGLGTEGNREMGDIDYNTLQKIARATGGEFYRAQSQNELSKIYNDIDKLEKTKIKTNDNRQKYEAYLPFALLALVCFLLEMVSRITIFRRIP